MTTIAYRDGILAADTRGFSGASTPIGNKLKIHQSPLITTQLDQAVSMLMEPSLWAQAQKRQLEQLWSLMDLQLAMLRRYNSSRK